MTRTAKKMSEKLGQMSECKSRAFFTADLQVHFGEDIALCREQADLLEAIHDVGSISAAGRKLKMSYRHAWLLADAMNRCFKKPLIYTLKGGVDGGGAQLTDLGQEVLTSFRAMDLAVLNFALEQFDSIKDFLKKSTAKQ